MNRVLLAIVVLLGAAAVTPVVARAQPATPLPPPPPPPPADPQTAPTVVPAHPPPPSTPPPRHGGGHAPPPPTPPPSWGEVEERRPRRAENLVFAEIGGNGIFYSVDYERLLGDSTYSIRAGFGFVRLKPGTTTASVFTVPVLANYYVGSRDHKLQLGAGITFISVSGNQRDSVVGVTGFVPSPTFAAGYRYLPARGGFTFFAGITPLLIPGRAGGAFLPWAGMSFGWVF